MSLVNNALHIASSGLLVLPLKAGGKIPLTAHGFKDASRDNVQISSWWRQWPEANVGLVIGEAADLCVLDVDPRHGGDKSLHDLQKKYGLLPKTVTVRTGGGGAHYYYKYDVRFFVPREYKKGLDVKNNGYVVVPPSIHASGRTYEWMPGLALGEIEVATLPGWLLRDGMEDNSVSKSCLIELLDGVSEGGRNDAIASLAGHLFFKGLGLEEVKSIALLVNQKNNPPLDDREVLGVVDSIQRKHVANLFGEKNKLFIDAPEEINDFLKRDIPPVEFIVDQMIQKCGRTMISAAPNKGKSLMSQNLALAITSFMGVVLEKFYAKKARVLYLDFEMGESLVKERFQKMLSGNPIGAEGLFIKCLLGKDILEDSFKQHLEKWIQDFKIELLVIDPIGSAWTGDENNKEEVSRLTSYLDSLIERFKVSILFVHHWRKASKEHKTGGEMAAGSYKFNAWVDVHMTLDGESSCLLISCQKARATARFSPVRARLNPETMCIEYLGDLEKKYTEGTLIELYSGMGKEWVTIPELIEESKKKGSAGKDVIRGLIKNSESFEIDASGKAHKIRLKKTEESDGSC